MLRLPKCAYVAQLIERFTRNEEVVGLIPAVGFREKNLSLLLVYSIKNYGVFGTHNFSWTLAVIICIF